MAGKLTIDSGQSLTIQGTGTTLSIGTGTTLTNNGTLNLGGTTFTNSGTFTSTASTSTVNYLGQTDDSTVTLIPTTYYNLITNNSGTTFNLGGTTTVANNFTHTAGTLNPNNYAVTGSGINALTITDTAKVDATTFAGSYASFEAITLNAGSTINYSKAGDQTIDNALSYKHLTISGSGIKILAGTTTVANNFTHTAGTLALSTYNLNIAENWLGNSNAVTGAGAIILNGSTQSITGNTTFNNLTFTSGQTITFAGGSTQTIGSTLTCQGTVGNLITLASSNTTPAILSKSSGAVVCDYINVSYSTAQGGATWNPGAHSIQTLGNNTGWDFTAPGSTATAISNSVSYIFNTWTNNNVEVTLTCQDNTGGTGCNLSYPKYCLDTTNTCDPTTAGTSYTTPFTISTEGTSYIRYYSQDSVSNIETVSSQTIKIDTTDPTVSAGEDQTKSAQFTQTGTATDTNGSGIASYLWEKISIPGTITFGTNTQAQTTVYTTIDGTYIIRLTAVDNVGHSSTDNFTLTWDTASLQSNNTSTVSPGGNNMQRFVATNQDQTNNQEMQRLQAIIEKLKAQITALIKKNTPQPTTTPNIPIADLPKNTPESPSSFQFTSTLKLGSMGSEVKQLQIKLKQLGFLVNTITPNGVFGKATLKALQDFQTQNNITIPGIYGYGIVGPRTRGVLNGMK